MIRWHWLGLSAIIIFSLVFIFLFQGCTKGETKNTHPAFSFYHWKGDFSPTAFEIDYIKALGVSRLYVRYFDVDKETPLSPIIPVSKVSFPDTMPTKVELVPVIFITNRTLTGIKEDEIVDVAEKIWSLINDLHPFEEIPAEIQLDCDWSGRSRSAFFDLIRHLQGHGCVVSSTIRLHQVLANEIPPADRGVLMFYNMGEVQDLSTENSILSLADALPYLRGLEDYELPLDIALPIFSWGVLFRDGKMIKLIHQLDGDELLKDGLANMVDSNFYEVQRQSVLRGHFLYRGDLIRLESSEKKDLIASATILADYFGKGSPSILFYHLDSINLKHYTHEFLLGLGREILHSRN